MIEWRSGDILKAKADALVIAVNTVGVMGRGLALQFRKAFPEMFQAYESACQSGTIEPGGAWKYDLTRIEPPRYITNVATKKHWCGKSKMEYVESGIQALVDEVKRLGIKSVAVPPLGCGLGGLDWQEVWPRIERAFAALPEVQVLLFGPMGAPANEAMAKDEKIAPSLSSRYSFRRAASACSTEKLRYNPAKTVSKLESIEAGRTRSGTTRISE